MVKVGRVRAVLMMAVLVHRLLAPADLRLADSSQIETWEFHLLQHQGAVQNEASVHRC